MYIDTIIVGAGISGLTCARELTGAGKTVTILDKGRGVGGRCSTWRANGGHLFDYGVTFLHGEDSSFISEFTSFESNFIDGWPFKVDGNGSPCQANAFSWRDRRGSFCEGISCFPIHLSKGLDIRNRHRVMEIEIVSDGLIVILDSGDQVTTQNLIFALPNEQTNALLDPLSFQSEEISGISHLLNNLNTFPCLTLMTIYPPGVPIPEWDLMLPDTNSALQLISNESSKRKNTQGLALLFQSKTRWSADRLEISPEIWANEILNSAAGILGSWAFSPTWKRTHRWRYARTDLASEIGSPILIDFGKGRIGIIGESFSRGVGIEGAFKSGLELAQRLINEDI